MASVQRMLAAKHSAARTDAQKKNRWFLAVWLKTDLVWKAFYFHCEGKIEAKQSKASSGFALGHRAMRCGSKRAAEKWFLCFLANCCCAVCKQKSGGASLNSKLKHFLDNFEGYCCVVTLTLMSFVVFIQVVFRFIIKSSLPWSEEMSRYLLVWTAYLGGAYGARRGAHIGVEAFTMLLPKKAQKVINIFIIIVSIILCAVIFKYGLGIVQTQLSGGQLSPAMRIPMGYMYAAIPIGMIFFIIRFVQELIFQLKHFKDEGGIPKEALD